MKKFDIPDFYRSSLINRIKTYRKQTDPRKKDFTPTILDFGPVEFKIARHFGFCYGVENAIEIAYKTLQKNPDKNIYLLSEMIHNPAVNDDLRAQGIQFVMDTRGNPYMDINDITPDDIVIIPAFGTTLEMENLLMEKGIKTKEYNTTCPFVEKVWNRANSLGDKDFTVVIHGKHTHEETRATFSHSDKNAKSLIVRDIDETGKLCDIILGKIPVSEFYEIFEGKYSEGFDPVKDITRIGVVNQTTMLASETEEISNCIKSALLDRYGTEKIKEHFADTRDTLCYATNDNQSATYGLMESGADLAIVVGGYNSSNTSHIVELLESRFPTFFISSADNISEMKEITHFNPESKKEIKTSGFLPDKEKITIALTSGASCPDSIVDEVLNKILEFFPKINSRTVFR